jgi:glycosyltransferase involved in cell wall biosynthesis
MLPVVSVIICTYNRGASLAATLWSLANMDVPEGLIWELLVVDNNSTDNTRGVINDFAVSAHLDVRYVFEPRQGKSYALNTGISFARGQVMAFTDDDVTVGPKWLVALSEAFERHDCLGVGGRIEAVWKMPKPNWLEQKGPHSLMFAIVRFDHGDEYCALEIPPYGANMAFRRMAFEKYGLFRVDLGPGYRGLAGGEDTEFCRRVMLVGEELIYAPDAVVFHPVEEYRARRTYYQSWYFKFGRAQIRAEGWKAGTRCYFGVPRYLFRELIENVFMWVIAIDRKKRFYYKLTAFSTAGAITEARSLSGGAKMIPIPKMTPRV